MLVPTALGKYTVLSLCSVGLPCWSCSHNISPKLPALTEEKCCRCKSPASGEFVVYEWVWVSLAIPRQKLWQLQMKGTGLRRI